MRVVFLELIGWYGMSAVLLAYALTTAQYIESGSGWFIFLNLSGAIGLALIAWYKRNFQSVVLNVVWAFIAIAGLWAVL